MLNWGKRFGNDGTSWEKRMKGYGVGGTRGKRGPADDERKKNPNTSCRESKKTNTPG